MAPPVTGYYNLNRFGYSEKSGTNITYFSKPDHINRRRKVEKVWGGQIEEVGMGKPRG